MRQAAGWAWRLAGSRDQAPEPDSVLPADLAEGLENGLGGPFRKWALSPAAQTHRLRRLRGPAKCRDCDAFMVSGIECEEVCGLRGHPCFRVPSPEPASRP